MGLNNLCRSEPVVSHSTQDDGAEMLICPAPPMAARLLYSVASIRLLPCGESPLRIIFALFKGCMLDLTYERD